MRYFHILMLRIAELQKMCYSHCLINISLGHDTHTKTSIAT